MICRPILYDGIRPKCSGCDAWPRQHSLHDGRQIFSGRDVMTDDVDVTRPSCVTLGACLLCLWNSQHDPLWHDLLVSYSVVVHIRMCQKVRFPCESIIRPGLWLDHANTNTKAYWSACLHTPCRRVCIVRPDCLYKLECHRDKR